MISKARLSLCYVIFSICISCGVEKKVMRQTSNYSWFPFHWHSGTVSGRYFDKLAITLPIGVNSLKGNFIAQFDLGSNASSVYGNPLKNYFQTEQDIISFIDTGRRAGSGVDLSYKTTGFNIKVGNSVISDLWYMPNFGTTISKDSLYSGKPKLVGTIGADFTRNKVLIIDYPNKKMCLLDTMDSFWASRASYVDCLVKNNRIHIPLKIEGWEYRLLFDTGASIFPVFTGHETWKSIADSTMNTDSLNISSWGEMVWVHGANIKGDAYLGTKKLSKGRAYYTTNKRLLEFNKQENISGTTGNAYFFNNIVIIDFKNKKFGIL